MNSEIGTLQLIPGDPIEAGSFGTWTFELEAKHGLAIGDTVEVVFFTRFSTNLWSMPQTYDPTAAGYVTAKRSDGGFVHLEVERIPNIWRPHGVTLHVMRATVGEEDLVAGASLGVVYGDPCAGSPGAQAQFLAREVVFPVFVGSNVPNSPGAEGSRSFVNSLGSISKPTVAEVSAAAAYTPTLHVVGGRAATLHVVLPSMARSRVSTPVRVTALDAHGNRAVACDGTVDLLSPGSVKTEHVSVGHVNVKDGRGRGDVTLPTSGVTRIVALDPGNRITGTAAPTVVTESEPETRIFWGEIHVHTVLSDALGRAEEHFEYAVHDAGLDFGAISDHDTWMARNPEAWEKVREVTERYNRPGRFATLLGYEAKVWAEGRYSSHANLYFHGGSAPLLHRPDISEVKRICEKHGAIVVPHHSQYGWPGMGTNWDDWEGFSAEEMPVVEIFSTHGCSEYFGCPRSVLWPARGQSVQDGLSRGHRFGLIGGSDYHECLLGHRMEIERYPRTINNRHMQTHSGLTAVFAKELTREAVFDAIRSRKVYATTGERIVLRFSVNGTPMGGEFAIKRAEEPRNLVIEAHGTRPVARIDVVRNGTVIHSEEPGREDVEFAQEDTKAIETGAYYYVRVTQAGGEQAWSSPVWVDVQT